MRKLLFILTLTLLSLSLNALEPLKFQKVEKGDYQVVKIYDGDTFTILVPPDKTVNIRINGIDAPERTQEFGLYARALLVNLINNVSIR